MSTNGSTPIGEPAQAGALKAAAPAARSSGLTEAELKALAKGMHDFLRDTFAPEMMETIETMMRTRQARLEERVRAIEERPLLEDCGVWNARTDYHPGNCVVHDGSSWIAKTWHSREQPGKSDSWRLMARKGRDGRDR